MEFFKKTGFKNNRQIAIDLLKDTINILDKYEIDYFLISGTLLGQVRHNDFIPWDDDIDLIVDRKIFNILNSLNSLKSNNLVIIKKDYIVKFCYKDRGDIVYHKRMKWDKFIINKCSYRYKYRWPFIDLFIFDYNDKEHLRFFNKDWDYESFYPYNLVNFLNISNVKIPKDPHYFLSRNYGNDYMTVYKSSLYDHSKECDIPKQHILNVSELEAEDE